MRLLKNFVNRYIANLTVANDLILAHMSPTHANKEVIDTKDNTVCVECYTMIDFMLHLIIVELETIIETGTLWWKFAVTKKILKSPDGTYSRTSVKSHPKKSHYSVVLYFSKL